MCARLREDWLWTTASHGSSLRGLGVPHQVCLWEAELPKQEHQNDGCHTRQNAWEQGQLVNTGAILALYQRQLAKQLEEGGSDLAAEVQQVSLLLVKLMKEQAVATGRAMASL